MDPVYGAVFARLLLGDSEVLGPQGILGGALVTGQHRPSEGRTEEWGVAQGGWGGGARAPAV